MTHQETEILIQKYLNGETTAEEEKLLALEVSREDAPSDWKIIAEMLGELTFDEALFDQIMAERKQKSRIIRLWPWVAAACVVALLVVFLGPPREETVSMPQIAKVEPKKDVATEPKAVEPKEISNSEASAQPLPTHKTKHKSRVSKKAEEEQQVSEPQDQPEETIEPIAEPENTTNEIAQAEEISQPDPIDEFRKDFHEKSANIRERGMMVMRRVAMLTEKANNKFIIYKDSKI